MKAQKFTKFLAMMLVVVLLLGMIPFNAVAAVIDFTDSSDGYYNLISKKDWELAPAVGCGTHIAKPRGFFRPYDNSPFIQH